MDVEPADGAHPHRAHPHRAQRGTVVGLARRDRAFTWVCFVLTWLALVATGPAGQLFDAIVYVNSSQLLVDGTAAPAGYGLRGFLTSLVYVPAVLAAKAGLPIFTGVLAQNAVLLGATGAFLLPALVRTVGAWSRSAVVGCCALVLVVLGRFAPAGLMDIWALAAVLAAVVLVARPGRLGVWSAGALLGVAVNLRPAYVLPLLLVLVAWALFVRRRWLWLALGSTMVALPQLLLELARPGSLAMWWDGLQAVNEVQVSFASWVVRYDTVPSSLTPQQFFCDPDMAALQQPGAAGSVKDLVGHLLTHMPQSIDLLVQKATAWLMWTWSTPFHDTFDPRVSQLGIVVVVLVVLGAFGWLRAWRSGDVPRASLVTVLAVTVGVMGGVVTSTPEARFALPLVALGIVGVLLVRFDDVRPAQGLVLAGVVVLVVLLGSRGLSHPAPPGPVTSDICATAGSADEAGTGP